MTRLVSLDYFRGIFIILVIFIHAIIFNIEGSTNDAASVSPIFYSLLLYFVTWAGIFAMISGISNCLSMYSQIRNGKTTPKKNLLNAFLTGIIILLVNYLYLILFSPGFITPDNVSIGILPGFLLSGQIYPLPIRHILFATALTMVAWGIIFTALLLFLLEKNDGFQKNRRNYLIVFIIATLFVWTYPLVQSLRDPYLTAPITSSKLFLAIIISWLVGPMDPIFPYVGFTLYGMVFGMMIIDNQKKSTILRYGYGTGGIYSIIGLIFYITGGFWDNTFDTPSLGPLMQILGPMLLIFTLTMHIMDLSSDNVKAWCVKHTKSIRAFGIISLTGFILEGSVSIIVRIIWELFVPNFTQDAGYVFLYFAPVIMIIWIIIIKLWSKIQFKGSFEWLIIFIMNKITGKKSDRLNVDLIIKNSTAYVKDPN